MSESNQSASNSTTQHPTTQQQDEEHEHYEDEEQHDNEQQGSDSRRPSFYNNSAQGGGDEFGGDSSAVFGGAGRTSFRVGADGEHSGSDLTRRGSQLRGSQSNLHGGTSSTSSSRHASGSNLNPSQQQHPADDQDQYDEHAQQHQQEEESYMKLPINVSPPAPLPNDPIVAAYQQFRVGFLKYDTQCAQVEVGDYDPFLSPKIAEQRTSLTDAPIVTKSMDTVLDALLPPRRATVTWQEDADNNGEGGGGFQHTCDVVQRVYHTQIKRDELRMLRRELDAKLAESKARVDGICPVRRAIHALMFDELIRQVTIDCPERGILLRRIRDEIQMTLDAHHALYEESVNYSTNRCVAAAKHTPAMTLAIDQLNREIAEMRKELKKLEAKHGALQRCVDEQQESDMKKYEEEKMFLMQTQKRLEDQLHAVKEAQEAQRRALRENAAS